MKTALKSTLKTALPILLGMTGTLAATMAPTYYAAVCGGSVSALFGG